MRRGVGVVVIVVVLVLALLVSVPRVRAVDGSPYAGKVVLNEVLYRGSCGGSSASSNDEFVELYVADDVNMCGWKVSDGNVADGDTDGGGGFIYTFNVSDTCQFDAGDYIVIWVGTAFTMTHADNAALQVHLGRGPKLNNRGDDVWLFDGSGKLVDYMAYGSDNGINKPSDPSKFPSGFWDWKSNAPKVSSPGQSLSLTPNGVDTNSGADWEPTTSGTAAGPTTVDTDDLDCSGRARVSSAGVSNNPPAPTPTPTAAPAPAGPKPGASPVEAPEPTTGLLALVGVVLILEYAVALARGS